MAALAASGDFRAAEAAREMAWEQLHSGPWHSVLPVWRDAYSMACIHVAKFHHKSGEFKEALRVLDLGLIMGGSLLRRDLDSGIEQISMASANSATDVELGGGRLVGEEFNQAEDMTRSGSRSLQNHISSPSSKQNSSHAWSTRFAPSLPKKMDRLTPLPFSKSVETSSLSDTLSKDLLSMALQVLPKRSLSCTTVTKRTALSLEGFLCDYLLSGVPVVISDCMAHWPARTRWNDIDYLKRVAGDCTVPVEQEIFLPFEDPLMKTGQLTKATRPFSRRTQVGKNYVCPEWKQELITFSQFLERIHSTQLTSAVLLIVLSINSSEGHAYPGLLFCWCGELRSLKAWSGPAGTVTPLHHDPHHNILAHMCGETNGED
ncbi:Cupin-like domain 8 [Dillenia turbinata]|uniref:Cupin-like domain 8 n=1 Tax=Dillenia turbinata TaxID=194707 RepID=A0AAN8Z7W1_9MAGN